MEYEGGFEKTSFNYRDQKTVERELKRLSWWKRFLFWWRRQVSIGKRTPPDFSGPMEFFLFSCNTCGPILTYPRGYLGMIDCMDCSLKMREEWLKTS